MSIVCVFDRWYEVLIPRNLSFHRSVAQLATSSRLEGAFMTLEVEESQLIVSATDLRLEGLELLSEACDAFVAATPAGRRAAILTGEYVPAQISELIPNAVASVVAGVIVSPIGEPLGFIVAYGDQLALESDRTRVQHSIEIIERHLDDKQEHSTQRATGMSLKIASDKLHRYSEKLKFENENLDLFAEFTAHEVKNPLRAIILCSDYLQVKLKSGAEDLSTDEVVGMLGQIGDEAQVLYDQIENILALGKPEVEFRRSQRFDLAEVAQQCYQRYAADLGRINGTMNIGRMETITGDPAQILMVMSNLVSNAIRYRSPDRDLQVSVESSVVDRVARICVTDNGIGIKPEDVERIFDAYTRCSPDLPGLGLGLALSQRSLEQVGGSIEVTSQLGEGSSFVVNLAQ